MNKFKKIVAAAIATATMGVLGATAFAYVNWGDDFALKFSAREENVFTESAQKVDSFEDAAAVTVHNGLTTYSPVYFSVWNYNDELYGVRLTKVAIANENYVTEQMPYDSSSTSVAGKNFFMNAYSAYDTDIEGVWAP